MGKTPKEEAEDLVDEVVNQQRSRIVEENENLINKIVSELEEKPFRDMNVVFSETRRQLEEVKNND